MRSKAFSVVAIILQAVGFSVVYRRKAVEMGGSDGWLKFAPGPAMFVVSKGERINLTGRAA